MKVNKTVDNSSRNKKYNTKVFNFKKISDQFTIFTLIFWKKALADYEFLVKKEVYLNVDLM